MTEIFEEQIDLFGAEQPKHDGRSRGYGLSTDGASKRFDPVTSYEAGEDFVASGKAEGHYNLIVDTLRDQYPLAMTNMEIAERSGLNQNQVTRRMTELERRDYVVRGENVICPILGRNCGTWKIK